MVTSFPRQPQQFPTPCLSMPLLIDRVGTYFSWPIDSGGSGILGLPRRAEFSSFHSEASLLELSLWMQPSCYENSKPHGGGGKRLSSQTTANTNCRHVSKPLEIFWMTAVAADITKGRITIELNQLTCRIMTNNKMVVVLNHCFAGEGGLFATEDH